MIRTAALFVTAPTPLRLGSKLDLHFSRDLLLLLAAMDRHLGSARVSPGHSNTKGIDIRMRMRFERPARVPMWIAGISVCVLAASGIVAIVRSIPASYASIPDDDASSGARGSEAARADGAQAHVAAAPETMNRRNRGRCRDCGVVESMRLVERSSDAGTQDTFSLARGVAADASIGAGAASANAKKNYEIKVRFRDGSTAVFNEANPRTWQLGSRVIVIGRVNTSNN